MKKYLPAISLLFPLLLLVSCNSFDMLKRRYTGGYYVHHSGKRNTAEKEKKQSAIAVSEEKNTEAGIAAVKNEPVVTTDNSTADNAIAPEAKETGVSKAGKYVAEKNDNAVAAKEKETGEDFPFYEREMYEQGEFTVDGALDEDGKFVLMLILSLLLPPLAVYLKQEKVTVWFWVTLILCLLSGVGLVGIGLLYSGWFIAFVIALLVVLDIIQ